MMLVAHDDSVLVQGITGRQGAFWSARMMECGTNLVAGTSPGKAGQEINGVPVYNSVDEATRHHQIDVSVLFVPPLLARDAALDAVRAGIPRVIMLTEYVPLQDTMEILAEAREKGVQVLGPNTAGMVVPGVASVGIMPGFATNIFQPGTIGVISRSGSLGTLVCLSLVSAGFGQSAFVGIGGDPILGMTFLEVIRELDRYERTTAVVLVGEIGGTMEEDAAEYISHMTKPVVAIIAGRTAPPGKRMGHAGAIVIGRKGGAESKIRLLQEAGATVVAVPGQIAEALHAAGVVPLLT